jgi:hypothetical protein
MARRLKSCTHVEILLREMAQEGGFAMPRFAGYMLICSFRSPPTAPVWEVLTRRFQRRVGASESYDQIESAVKRRARPNSRNVAKIAGCDWGTAQSREGAAVIFALINAIIIAVIGAIGFYLIDRFVRDGRLGNLLKILVMLVRVLAILQRQRWSRFPE